MKHYNIGDIVRIAEHNDNDNYDKFRNKKLIITHKVTRKDNHPLFDESLPEQALYSFEGEDGENIPFSLYDYEIELY